MNPVGTRIEGGGIRIARAHDGNLHWHAGRAAPLMMAKERKKKGKGKAGRVDLIERYGREGNTEGVLSGNDYYNTPYCFRLLVSKSL